MRPTKRNIKNKTKYTGKKNTAKPFTQLTDNY